MEGKPLLGRLIPRGKPTSIPPVTAHRDRMDSRIPDWDRETALVLYEVPMMPPPPPPDMPEARLPRKIRNMLSSS
jgi:hypothetical protein